MCCRLLLAAGILLILGAIAIAVAVAMGVFQSPEVVSASNHWGEVNDQNTTIITDIVIDNPNPVGIAVGRASVVIDINLNGVHVGQGKSQGIDIKEGESANRVVTTFDHDQLPDWWASHIRSGEHTVWTVDVKLEVAVFGRTVTVPVTADGGEFSTHIIEQLNSYQAQPLSFANYSIGVTTSNFAWTDINNNTSTLEGTLSLHNETPVSIQVAQTSFTLTMNGIQVGQGQTAPNVQVQSDGVTDVPVSFTVNHQALKQWWPTHIENSERSDVELVISLTVAGDLPRPIGHLELKLPAITVSDTLQTDLLRQLPAE